MIRYQHSQRKTEKKSLKVGHQRLLGHNCESYDVWTMNGECLFLCSSVIKAKIKLSASRIKLITDSV